MSVAQDLYEAGFITYMRTDSVTLSDTAITAARNQVRQLFGADYLPDRPRVYTSKVKNAQEAHEAIRPAGETFLTPAQTRLTGDQFRLYELIWMRTIASQMKDAEGRSITVDRSTPPPASTARRAPSSPPAGPSPSTASSRPTSSRSTTPTRPPTTRRPGCPTWPRASRCGRSRSPRPGHETRPPARYTEPSLVAKLEELEIGRPSTYASILRTITSRDYVFKKGSALVPTWLAFAVTRLLEEHFPKLVDYAFTAEMEEVLDQIAGGNAERIAVLTDFYFGADGRPRGAAAAGLRAGRDRRPQALHLPDR